MLVAGALRIGMHCRQHKFQIHFHNVQPRNQLKIFGYARAANIIRSTYVRT